MNSPHCLPSELTIYTACETRLTWLSWLAEAADTSRAEVFAFDAAGVQEVDAAGVQLLLSLQRTLAARQQTLSLVRPSPALAAACQALGAQALVAES